MSLSKGSIATVSGSSEPAGDKQPQHVMLVDTAGAALSIGGKTIKTAAINVSSSGNTEIVSSVATRIKVTAISLSHAGTVNSKWRDGAGTDLSAAQPFSDREGYVLAGSVTSPLLQTTAGNPLILHLSAAIAATGWIAYFDDDAT